MIGAEPIATAVVLTAFGGLLAASVGLSRVSARLGLPVALLFLLVGVVAGSEGLGHIGFEDYGFAFRVGTTALVLILFDGGLNTPAASARQVLAPATVLATVGVVATAGLVAVAAHLFGLSWAMAMLLGAIVSSTDAAAVFSVLTASGTRLRRRVGLTLELESGLNDPMAVILTTAITAGIAGGAAPSALAVTLDVVRELAIGAVTGYVIARVGRLLIMRVHLPAAGLYPAFTLAVACLSFGLATLLHGSGFLAVYVTGMTLGSGVLPHAVGIRRVHDALGWLSQVLMFLLLGLLVFPSRLLQVATVGLTLALFLAVVARPVIAMLCLAPFRYRWRDSAYVGWVGLRGAVPIVLATIPVMADVPGAHVLFDIVFFIVVVGALVPGATVPWMARLLRVESDAPPPPATMIEVDARAPRGDELRAYFVSDQLAVAGATLAEIPFPEGAAVSMLERGGALIAPSGATRIEPGDYVYVIAPVEHRPLVELLFGRSEEH
ncbi:MAG: potassium/proton antiporter [Gemmatimonadaceae bacterium]|nr:potassium/proton antiporter [Gemmatimonadaceae bacterium]NUS34385.1 potassium/proton antiporter [Gemmatimonadaceae bacterium]